MAEDDLIVISNFPSLLCGWISPNCFIRYIISTYIACVDMRVKYSYKAAETTRRKKEGWKNLSPRNKKACRNIALLLSVTEIGAQSTKAP
jgi:hypothetical protein